MRAEYPLLSIIVPVYMVEKYLCQCIDSLLAQTYPNKEIVIVDDGSKDLSGVICDEYAQKHTCIKVIHTDNRGISSTWNCGMEHSEGEYFAFVDADDYVRNIEAFSIMLTEAFKEHADIVIGNYHRDIQGQLIPAREHAFLKTTDTLSSDFRFRGFFSIGHLAYTWGKVYKSSFLRAHGLALKQYPYAADKLFNIECYLKNPKYGYVSDYVYVYRYNSESISHRYIKDYSRLWMRMSEDIHKLILKDSCNKAYMDLVVYNLLLSVFFCCKQEYMHSHRSLGAMIAELKKFRAKHLMIKLCREVAAGKYLDFCGEYHWKLLLRGLSFGLCLKMYWLLSLGMKLMIDINYDGRLSSIGPTTKKFKS